MAVVLSHTMELDASLAQEMEEKLRVVSDRLLGAGEYYIDKKQRSIYDHCHWHARPITAFHKMMMKMREQKVPKAAL
jgi:aspartyl/asparaginyl beta-hydroxylase (cupin superfamily)